MRKTFLLSVLVILSAGGIERSAYAKETIKADDSRITYIGRTAIADGEASFDWSGVTMIVNFEGTSLSLTATDTETNSFNVWIDKEQSAKADKVIKINGTQTVASKLSKGKHTVILQKRTEGEQGKTTICSLSTDGTFSKARSLKERRIEFVGDSYTCGYGTESGSRDDPFRADEENCNLAYDFITGRFFDADVQLVSHSGRGVARNYAGLSPDEIMPNKYMKTFDCSDGPEWKSDSFDPSIVVIYLGTNDFSGGVQPTIADWSRKYIRLINEIRDIHPSAPILCVASKADVMLGDYVERAVTSCGLDNIFWTSIQDKAHNDTAELGASWHPNYEGQRKVASLMIPYISTITGWEMPHKVIE